MFKRNVDKQTIDILIKENQKLLRENTRLRESLNELEKYKNMYAKSIEDLKKLKVEYSDALKEINKIKDKYEATLNKLISKTNKTK